MKIKPLRIYGDKWLWFFFFLLTIVSVVSVYTSIGLSAATDHGTSAMRQEAKHVVYVLCSYAAAILVACRSRNIISIVSWLLCIGSTIMVYWLLFRPDAERWVSIGVFSLQPSEIAKVSLVVTLASLVQAFKGKIDSKFLIRFLLGLVALVVFPIFMKNGSTGILLFAVCWLLLLFSGVGTARLCKYTAVILLALFIFMGVRSCVGVDSEVGRSYTWGHRIESFFNPDFDEITQENIARMAVARGGAFGVGIGNTIHGRLMEEAHNDFIFAVIIEEIGSVPAMFILLIYVLFFFRCIYIATRSDSLYGSLSVAGLGLLIFFQAVVNMAVAVGALPVTGQTLPFISMGGSSYVFMACGLGVIQSVARDNKRRQVAQGREAQADENTINNQQQIETI